MNDPDIQRQAAECVEQFCLPQFGGDVAWQAIIEISKSSKRGVLYLGHFSDHIPIEVVKRNVKDLYEACLWPTTGSGIHRALERLDATFLKDVWEPIAIDLDSTDIYHKEQPNKFHTDIGLYKIISKQKAREVALLSLNSSNREVKMAAEEYLEDDDGG